MVSIQFDESFSYYDIGHKIIDKDNNGVELDNIWNKADNEEFGKVIVRKQGSVITDSGEEEDNNSFSELAIDNNHPLPNQPMPSIAVPNEILSPLTDIFGANISLSPKTFYDLGEEENLPRSPNILQSDYTTDQSGNSYQSRTKSGIFKRVDYKNSKRLGKAMLIFHKFFTLNIYLNLILIWFEY